MSMFKGKLEQLKVMLENDEINVAQYESLLYNIALDEAEARRDERIEYYKQLERENEEWDF